MDVRAAVFLAQPGALAVFVVVAPLTLQDAGFFPLLVLAGIYGVAVVGVSMLAGLAGQLTLGHAAIVGVGAYASALGTVRWHLSPIVGLALGVACAVAVAAVTSPILRLRGWYLAVATIALAAVLQRVAVNLESITGGDNGIYGIPPFSVGGVEIHGQVANFYVAWTLILVLLVGGRNIVHSRYGRAMAAIHKDEDAAVTLAVPAMRYKATLWVMAAVPAAMAGTLFAHYSAYVSPNDFGLGLSATLFVAVILGGSRSMFASIVALTFLVCMPAFVPDNVPPDLVKGLALVLVYLLCPRGLGGLAARTAHSITGRRVAHA